MSSCQEYIEDWANQLTCAKVRIPSYSFHVELPSRSDYLDFIQYYNHCPLTSRCWATEKDLRQSTHEEIIAVLEKWKDTQFNPIQYRATCPHH